jgi:hypothetical protein
MSSNAAVLKFIAVVELHFPRPKFNGDEQMESAWLKSMNMVLGGYSDEVIASAAERILMTRNPKRDGRFFPSPQECTEACDKAAAYRQKAETPLLTKPPELTYEERTALARDLMKAPIGRQAVRDGWGEAMFHFIVEHRRAPAGQEVDECRRSARQFKADYERLLRGDHPFANTWAKYAEGMVQKARELMGEKVA